MSEPMVPRSALEASEARVRELEMEAARLAADIHGLGGLNDSVKSAEQRCGRLEKALGPFAECADRFDGVYGPDRDEKVHPDDLGEGDATWSDEEQVSMGLTDGQDDPTVADFRRARAALSGRGESDG